MKCTSNIQNILLIQMQCQLNAEADYKMPSKLKKEIQSGKEQHTVVS